MKKIIGIFAMLLVSTFAWGQQISKEEMLFLTPLWKGERFADGRPKASDALLQRLKSVTLEEAWAVFMPGRPDIQRVIDDRGHTKDGRIKSQNSWPIDMLVKGDVYVVDQFGAHEDGPTIGDNLGNSIYAKTGNGIVYNGAVRDINGLKELGRFTSFFRTYHPSHHLNNPDGELNTTLVGINTPTRIGKATVLPGDVVLGRDGGVIFIPPHLLEKVVKTSEIVRLRDMFGHQRLREQKYTPGQIDNRWSEEIEKDFSKWLNDKIDKLPVPKAQIQEFLKGRTW